MNSAKIGDVYSNFLEKQSVRSGATINYNPTASAQIADVSASPSDRNQGLLGDTSDSQLGQLYRQLATAPSPLHYQELRTTALQEAGKLLAGSRAPASELIDVAEKLFQYLLNGKK